MTKLTKAPAPSAAGIEPAAYYSVVLGERAVLPHETLPARDEPYEMSGRLLATVIDKAASYAKID